MATLAGDTTDSGGGDFFAAGEAAGTRWIAAASGTVDTIKAKFTASGFTSLKVAIYTDAAGTPATLLGEGTITVTTPGEQSAPIAAEPAVVSGSPYWLMWLPIGGDINFNGSPTGVGYKGQGGLSTFPSTWGATGIVDGSSAGIPIAADGTDGGGGDPEVEPDFYIMTAGGLVANKSRLMTAGGLVPPSGA